VALDQAAQLLESTLARKTHLAIGFIGEAQVGKSSLINALVERSALPSGGIGPLAAQATRVSFSEEDRLEVSYHSHERLKGVRLSLEGALVRRGELSSSATDAAAAESEAAGPAEELGIDLGAVAPQHSPDNEPLTDDAVKARAAAEERFAYLMAQLWSMLGDNMPDEEGRARAARPANTVLVDGLRAVLGERSRHPETVVPYQARIDELRRCLGQSETITRTESRGSTEFVQALKARSAGWLPPLVKNLDVGLCCELLRSLSLVDLPGIGVRADPGALVAEDFVNGGGDVLVVVMRNSGLTDSVARLLEQTGVINRLLMEGGSPLSIRVLVVVTHLDDVAKNRWQDQARAARATGQRAPDLHHIFLELARQMSSKARDDIRHALLHSPSAEELTDERRVRRAQRVQTLCEAMDVVCVAAPDYLSLIESFPDMAFLKDPEATNVPKFRLCLENVAAAHATLRSEAISEAKNQLCMLANDYLRTIASAYEEGRGGANGQWETFRIELEKAMQPLRDQMNVSHGELLAQLNTALPLKIQQLCAEAEKGAKKKLKVLLKQGEKLLFQSLNAALRRDGVWEKRGINYPDSLTQNLLSARPGSDIRW